MYRMVMSALLAVSVGAVWAESAQSVWDIFGSFGKVKGEIRSVGGQKVLESEAVRVAMREETDREGVTVRQTVVKNISQKDISVHCLLDRYVMEGGEYEVYTQASSWEYESRGAWQALNTGVHARGSLICGSNGAAPMLAIWNVQTGRGRVFHLLSDGAWEMSASLSAANGGMTSTKVAVEMGVDSRHLNYLLQPGKEVSLPEIITYEFTSKTDLDCHKLHAYWNRRHPATRPQPTIYNSWLCRFDKLEPEFVLKQVEKAKTLGVDYFVLDAGWFGPKADWGSVRGDWSESPDGYLGGRMADISKAVRDAGMKFGFWLEAESAVKSSRIVKEHPEYFTVLDGVYFLDFTRKDAFDYIVKTTCALLEKYHADFMKFDFNQNADFDPTGKAFIAYNAAFREFIREVRRRHPGVYIEGCASGGLMMNLGWAKDYDSIWPTDNQSPYHGMRIIKETMLRMPPRLLERWLVARTVQNIQPDYGGRDSRLIATDNGTWTRMRSVTPDYLDAFTAGGPVGFSCDLTAFAESDLKHFAQELSNRRQNAAFWNAAVGRILSDTPSVVVLQYDANAFDEIRIVAVADNLLQSSVTVYPRLDASADYLVDGKPRRGAELVSKGIVVPLRICSAAQVSLKKITVK